MNGLKEAVLAICFCAIAVGVIEMLIPKNKYKAQMRLITGTVLMLSLLTPFISGIDLDLQPAQGKAVLDSEILEKSAAASAKEQIRVILYDHDITYAKIVINTDTNADNRIVINEAQLFLNKGDIDRAVFAAKEIEEQLGIKTVIGELE